MRPYYPTEKASIVTSLQDLMERFCAPDLTVAEARDLHPQLARLLDSIEGQTPRKVAGSGDRKVSRDPNCCLAV